MGLLAVAPALAEETPRFEGPFVEVVEPHFSPPLRLIPAGDPPSVEGPRDFRRPPARIQPGPDWDDSNRDVDPLAAMGVNGLTRTPSPILNFQGLSNECSCSPPDTVGAAGLNHYVQMVNATRLAVFNKTTGAQIGTTINLNQLWAGSGDATCSATSDGDPIVVYDYLANRFVLAQFFSNGICVAVSQGSDPTGSYNLYRFNTPEFPDYYKIGAWTDAYYVSANENSYSALALDRAAMLAGTAATSIRFAGQDNLLMPATVVGATAPPANTPGIFYTFKDNSFHGGVDRLEMFHFVANFTTPASSTFTLAQSLPITSYTYTVCGFFVLNCIPQGGTTQRVDPVSEWPMWQLQYRNFGAGVERLVANFAVDVGSDRAGIRWYELSRTGTGTYGIVQEGTYAPADGLHRWMGSIAMDRNGGIALGYSASSSTERASVRYATRLPSDPVGTLQTEVTLHTGAGSQTASNRWGDYSALTVDPADNCTFWFTNEYYAANSGNGWTTRIGNFVMPECLATATVAIGDVTVTETDAGGATADFTVTRSSNTTAFSVAYATADGTAVAGSDYVATSGTLNFAAAGGLSQTVSVPLAGDLVVEGSEGFVVNLGAVVNTSGSTTVSDGQGNATVNDNDSAVVQFSTNAYSRAENASPLTATVTLSNPVQSGVSLTVNSSFGTATAADFTPIVNGSVAFPINGNASQAVDVTLANDALDEDDETFGLTLSGLVATGNVSLGTASATGTIVDDDPLPTLSISSPSQVEGNAGSAPMNFVLTLTPASGRDVGFTRATADGSATAADNDYQALAAAAATITAGQTSLTIPVQVNGDNAFEPDQSFSLNLSAVSNATPAALSGTGTILNDDAQTTTTTITDDSPDPTVVGEPYLVSVRVSGVSASPTGSVNVRDGAPGSPNCNIPLFVDTSPDSLGSCSLTSTSAGAKTLTADYTPDSGAFLGSSGTITHQVNPAATSISVSGPPRSRINTPTSFSFALGVLAPGAGTPAGTVTLSSGAASCQVTVPTLTPSCMLSFDTLGPRTVSAAFVPADGNFLGASSSGPGNAQTLVYALADLAIGKSDGAATFGPEQLIVYSVDVRNLGPDTAVGIRVRDPVPVGLVDVVWSCDASGGAGCPQAGGSGDLDQTIATIPPGGLLGYTFFGNADDSPAQISNVATLETPADGTVDDPVTTNNSASDLNLLDPLFRFGFEDALVNAAAGSVRMPDRTTLRELDGIGRLVFVLDDADGEAARVYVRLFEGRLQYALALRGAGDRLRLGAWSDHASEPTLHWSAEPQAAGWRLRQAELR